jgi:GNAT superfamily N-acetyltransferase
MQQPVIRDIKENELPALLELYRHLHRSDPVLETNDKTISLWKIIFNDPQQHYLVVEQKGQLVASCTLVIIPNLTRSGRSYGLIENVVTHSDFRRQGLGTALLRHALDLAWASSCYKVMLLTGRKDKETIRFYEKAGFKTGIKTGFVATPG